MSKQSMQFLAAKYFDNQRVTIGLYHAFGEVSGVLRGGSHGL